MHYNIKILSRNNAIPVQIKFFLPLIIWTVIITVLSILPSGSFSRLALITSLPVDKFIHFIMYFVLSFSLLWGIKKQKKVNGTRFVAIIVVFLVVTTYGLLIELVQLLDFVGRSTEIFDILANAAGCICGIFIFFIIFEDLLGKIIKNRSL